MLTIFTIPKAFHDHIGIIQKNAIWSWKKLHPDCEIILFGDEDGIEDVAKECNVKWVSDIKKNEFGTPAIDFVFEQVQKIARHNVLCYANADIILLSDIIRSIQKNSFTNYLMVGSRKNLSILEPIDFDIPSCEDILIKNLMHSTQTNPYGGIDIFIFNKGSFTNIPPFTVGRAGWDNWLIYHARKEHIPVIDITPSVNIIHQNHDYNHVPLKRANLWDGPESDQNLALLGNKRYQWTVDDADWILTREGIVKKPVDLDEMYRIAIIRFPRWLHPFLIVFSLPGYIKRKLKI